MLNDIQWRYSLLMFVFFLDIDNLEWYGKTLQRFVRTNKCNKVDLTRFKFILYRDLFSSASNTAANSSVYFVALNLQLNASERLQLVNGFFSRGINLDNTYALIVRMVINSQTMKIGEPFSSVLMYWSMYDFSSFKKHSTAQHVVVSSVNF